MIRQRGKTMKKTSTLFPQNDSAQRLLTRTWLILACYQRQRTGLSESAHMWMPCYYLPLGILLPLSRAARKRHGDMYVTGELLLWVRDV